MKYIFTALVLIVFSPVIVKAQNNFKPGYIVNFEGDTVRGVIDHHEWWNNPKTFLFKKTNNDKPKTLTTGEAREVAFNEFEHYIAFTASISKGKIDPPNLPSAIDSTSITADVFLKLIYRGKQSSLLSYKDGVKTRFYTYEEADHSITELNYYVFSENGHIVKTVRSYQLQLLALVSKYNVTNDKLTRKIMAASYSEGDLFKVFQLLNNDDTKASNRKSLVGLRLFAGGGGRNATLTFRSYAAVDAGASVKNSGAFFSAGADLLFNKNTRRAFFRGEFTYFNNTFVRDNIPSQFNNGHYNNSLNVKQTTFGFLPQFIYNFYETDDVKFFAGLGLGINWSTYKLDVSKSDALDIEFDKNWFSLPIKMGVLFNNHFEAHIGYTTLGTVQGIGAINHSSFEGGFNYLF